MIETLNNFLIIQAKTDNILQCRLERHKIGKNLAVSRHIHTGLPVQVPRGNGKAKLRCAAVAHLPDNGLVSKQTQAEIQLTLPWLNAIYAHWYMETS